jgi:hypothetical protein
LVALARAAVVATLRRMNEYTIHGTVTVRRGDQMQTYTGRTRYVERGVRIYWLDSDVGPDDQKAIGRVTDVCEPHTIDWMSEDQYAAHERKVHETAAKNIEFHRRAANWPSGYEPAKRAREGETCRQGFRRLSDGAVHGWYRTIPEALEAAWTDSDGKLAEFRDYRECALENGEALPLAGTIADVCR